MNDPHGQLWIITTTEGTAVSAHCAVCMAGLGKCCSHIVSVLFYLEVWTRLNGKLACTQVKCTWPLPSTVKQVEYARVRNINFASAKKIRSELDKSIASVNFSSTKSSSAAQSNEPTPAENKPALKPPSKDELQQFYKALSECRVKPVCLSLIHPHSETFISTTRDIKAIPDLYEKKYLDLSYPELLQECYKVDLKLSGEQIKATEWDTIDQAKGSAFFRQRAGRIDASNTAPSKNGCKDEALTIAAYEKTMKETHANFVVTKCGIIINNKYQFLRATPDFLCECDCCGQRCGEVKCPFCIEGLDFDSYVQMKASCLDKHGDEFMLKRDHNYYFQSQQQIHTAGRAYLDFIVLATDGTSHQFVKQRLLPDIEHWETQIPKLETFWRICVLPEILGRWYTRNMDLKSQISPRESWPSEQPGVVQDCHTKSRPSETVCINSETPVSSSSSPASIHSETLQSEPSTSMGSQTSTTDPDVLLTGTTINLDVDKTSSLGSLTERDFALITSPCGWLDSATIHQAQLCLKKINPNMEGFQRPTLGLCKNFDVVSGEFVQLLHTGFACAQ
ncbi:hypothetical protein AWC38_SpisGene3233 [Stylophora pistillata]|uniref:YqaJ viral recombinase domain-containing protein n=1 Tax=Stylophora pistillata TaxID=50429 RepID=A0A2B4SSA7_STYPI|nr:hypothetical protein AWC38_SpisGene3233 [Stylophora pistillata]